MKKLIAAVALISTLAVGTGLAVGLHQPQLSNKDIENGIANSWNVQEVEFVSWNDDKAIVILKWKELPKAIQASEQLCKFFPIDSVHWNNKLGEPRGHLCGM